MLSLIQGRYRIIKAQSDLSASFIFEHGNGLFKAIDYGDRDNPVKFDTRDILKDPKCLFVLKCHIRPGYHHPKIRPFFYMDKAGKDFPALIDRLRKLPKHRNRLYFRGNTHLGRQDVLDQMKDLLNESQESVGQNAYFRELAQHRIALSLRGMAKTNHREFEAFAVGTPVIMERNPNIFHKSLVPDFHYISFDPGDDFVGSLRERLEQVDDEFLEFVRVNAMEYYDRHIRFDNSVLWMLKLLEL